MANLPDIGVAREIQSTEYTHMPVVQFFGRLQSSPIGCARTSDPDPICLFPDGHYRIVKSPHNVSPHIKLLSVTSQGDFDHEMINSVTRIVIVQTWFFCLRIESLKSFSCPAGRRITGHGEPFDFFRSNSGQNCCID
jgi:hypothetical protein